MQTCRTVFPRLLRRGLAGAFGLALAGLVHAQALPGGGELGMSAQQLQQAVPGLERVPRPVRMTGGLAGSWRGPAVALAGVTLTPTFFLAAGELRRVEYVATADGGSQAYDALLAWGRETWGPELASQGSEGAYATWTVGAADAYLQLPAAAPRPLVRLVLKLRAARDAGEL